MYRPLTLLLLLSFFVPGTQSVKTRLSQTPVRKIDSLNFVILPDTAGWNIFEDGVSVNLTIEDLEIIDSVVNHVIETHNQQQEIEFKAICKKHPFRHPDRRNFIIELRRYKRQYVPVMRPNGEKEVWVNCLCDESGQEWRHSVRQVMDGGNCFFQMKINLSQRRHFDFFVNGEA